MKLKFLEEYIIACQICGKQPTWEDFRKFIKGGEINDRGISKR